jgi:hypothetical protein
MQALALCALVAGEMPGRLTPCCVCCAALCGAQELLKNWEELPPMLVTSSRSGSGKSELLAHIAQLKELFNKGGL